MQSTFGCHKVYQFIIYYIMYRIALNYIGLHCRFSTALQCKTLYCLNLRCTAVSCTVLVDYRPVELGVGVGCLKAYLSEAARILTARLWRKSLTAWGGSSAGRLATQSSRLYFFLPQKLYYALLNHCIFPKLGHN